MYMPKNKFIHRYLASVEIKPRRNTRRRVGYCGIGEFHQDAQKEAKSRGNVPLFSIYMNDPRRWNCQRLAWPSLVRQIKGSYLNFWF
jgi:hypothetical protein